MKSYRVMKYGKLVRVDFRDCDGRARTFKMEPEMAKRFAKKILKTAEGK